MKDSLVCSGRTIKGADELMFRRLRNLPMTAQILLGVFVVLAASETYKVTSDISDNWKEIEKTGELRGNVALDMLESVHVQAMLNRSQIEDGDPVVEALIGTMDQFSRSNENTDIWISMAPKVLQFQRNSGQLVHEPRDELDHKAMSEGIAINEVEGDKLRLTRPVILGQGSAADEMCEGCHTGMMEVSPGEVLGAYSASVDLAPQIAAWRAQLGSKLVSGALTLALTLGFIMVMLRITALKPLRHLGNVTKELAEGNVDVTTGLDGRKDEIGALARTLEVFRQAFISNKRLEREAEEHRREAEANRLADQERAEAAAAERLRIATSGLAAGMKKLASGDLSCRIDEKFAPEFEELRADFNASIEQLADTLRSISDAATSIDRESASIAQGVDELSQRTEHQASSLEQTSAALAQITGNVSASARRVVDAQSIAAKANESAESSASVVANAEEAMSRIQEASASIGNIISVIDEIAFQTNLLALNAGVEAARAGDAGKGFAVVAQEVRALAGRSSEAANEVRKLIDNSNHEVEGGVKHVRETGDALKTIGEMIAEIHTHMDAIASTSREQSTGIEEVNKAVDTLDQVTQNNVAMVERASASGAGLAVEASRLADMVGRFKLEGGNVARRSGRAA